MSEIEENNKYDKVVFWFVFIVLFVAFTCLSHILLAQNEIDVNGVINKGFNTSADNVYGTLVGMLMVLVAFAFSIIGYLIRFIVKFLPQLNSTLQQNTKAFEDLETTIRTVVTNEVKTIVSQSEANIIRAIYDGRNK